MRAALLSEHQPDLAFEIGGEDAFAEIFANLRHRPETSAVEFVARTNGTVADRTVDMNQFAFTLRAELVDSDRLGCELRDTQLLADLTAQAAESILQQIGQPELMNRLRLPGYIPNGDLPAVYNGASAFLYTSLRESFGIPQLEAMACGTPVVTSNTSAIPEIAGEGAILVDPTSPEAIAGALLRLETDDAFRTETIAYGLERVKLFSWEQTARKLLTLYRELAGQ